jgi:hypothetical protein
MDEMNFLDKIDKIRELLDYPSAVQLVCGEQYLENDKRLDALRLLQELRDDASLMLEDDDQPWMDMGDFPWGEC